MDTKNLLKIINKELTLLSDIIESLSPEGIIHPIEIDLALSKTNDLYEELQLLKEGIKGTSTNLHLQSESEKNYEKKTEIKNKPESQKPLHIETHVPEDLKTEDTIAVEIKTEPEENNEPIELIQPEPEKPLITEVLMEEQPVTTEPEKEEPEKPIPVTEPEKKVQHPKAKAHHEKNSFPGTSGEIIADRFQSKSPSVNDVLGSYKLNKDLASHFKDRPIESLKKAIKINDRIWYTKELFNDNSQLFEQTVLEIDGASSLDEVLEQLFKQFTWDQNKKSTISFLELIFRRFANQ